jgi:uncharacterized protein (DUF2336 family)
MNAMSSGDNKGVNILDPKELLLFAQDTSPDGRGKLATAISTFFDEHDLNEVEQRLAGEIIMNLVRQAETDLREALAERMSVQENVPQEVILFFANDQISVARKVLTHSPVLKDIDLLFVIQSQSQDHWRAIAKRDAISPTIADRLIDTNDPGTVLELVSNQRVRLQKSAMKKIFRVATVSEDLQAPLLRRPEVDSEMATSLFMVVSHALRKELTERFPMSAQTIERSFEILVQELTAEARGSSEVSSEMGAIAKRFRERDEITPDLLIRTLRRGQMGFFIALFAEKAEFPHAAVVRMIQKDGGKPFIVTCRGINMMKAEFASLFLLSRGIRTGDKIVDQRELAMALKYFDALKDFDVSRIVRSWVRDPALI